MWPQKALKARYEREVGVYVEPAVAQSPAMSSVSVGQDHHSALDVPGVGEIPTTWIGRVGQRRMGRLIEQEELRPIVKGLQSELRVLASSCLKALNKQNTDDTDVVNAVQLCKHYTAGGCEKLRDCKATRIAELWRRQEPTSTTPTQAHVAVDRAVALGKDCRSDI